MNPPIKRPSYIESHSALRGIAALTVFLGHLREFGVLPREGMVGRFLEIIDWGSLAVFLFFVLSGFVMSHVYPSPVRWRHFFIARLARLLPVYQVTTLLLIVLLFYSGDRKDLTGVNIVANLLMIQRWFPIPGWTTLNPPSWSLSVEVFLYVFAFPLLIWSRNLPWNKILNVLLVVIGIAWATIYYDFYRSTFFQYWCFPILSGLCGFGMGFAIRGLMGEDLKFPKTVAILACAMILLSLVYRIAVPSSNSHGLLGMGLVLLVVSSVDPRGLPYRILARPSLVYLGDISYSLYLWHLPVMMILLHGCAWVATRFHVLSAVFSSKIVVGALILSCAFTVSTLSYYKLEVPFRRLIRDRFVRPKAGATLPSSPS